MPSTPLSGLRDVDEMRRVLSNARAAERERLRNIARRNHPELDGDDLEAKVRELELEKLRNAGRLGRAAQQRRSDAGAAFIGAYPELIARIIDLLDYVNSLDPDLALASTASTASGQVATSGPAA